MGCQRPVTGRILVVALVCPDSATRDRAGESSRGFHVLPNPQISCTLSYYSAGGMNRTRWRRVQNQQIGIRADPNRSLPSNWLQVLGGAETPHIDQGVRQPLHPIVPLLNVFKTEEQPLELVLPPKRPFHSIP